MLWSPFGAKICSDICPQILSIESVAQAYFHAEWRLLCLLSFKYFSPHVHSFENWGILYLIIPQTFPNFSWGIFSHMTHLGQSRMSKNI